MTWISRRLVASVLAWTVGAVAAVGVGVLALSQIGDGLTSRTVQPLTPEAVAREASAAPTDSGAAPAAAPSAATPGASARSGTPTTAAGTATAPAGAGTEKLVWSPGGTAIARCAGGQAYLVSWSPEQGYRADNVSRGPASVVSVKFESDNAKVFLSVRCAGDDPQPTVNQRADDHGGSGGKDRNKGDDN